MKILIVSFYYSPEVGAAPSRITNLANGLKELGVDVEVLTCMPNYPQGYIFDNYRGKLYQKEIIDGITIHRYWSYATISKHPLKRAISMLSYSFIIWLFSLKRKLIKSYDRVLIQSPPLPVAYSAILLFKKVFGKKCIINISDLWPGSAVELGAIREGSMIYHAFKYLEKKIYHEADGIMGQSNEILDHVQLYIHSSSRLFLYRNLQKYQISYVNRKRNGKLKLVYAGLLGVAQDIMGLISQVPFKDLDVEFHVIGGGAQLDDIKQWCNNNTNSLVKIYGFVPKHEMHTLIKQFDASIVPLATRIHGAVPSKIFDILPQGLPLLFCGDGEGAQFVKNHKVGWVCAPSDYKQLINNIKELRDMENDGYENLSAHCIEVSKLYLDFDSQIKKLLDWLLEDTK